VWRATVAGLLARRARLLSTALAIVLGVAFVTGTLVLSDTLDRAFDDLFGDVGEAVDVQVAGVAPFAGSSPVPAGPAPGPGPASAPAVPVPGVPDDVVEQVRAVPGVAAVEPRYAGVAQLIGDDGQPIGGQGPPVLGVGVPTVPALSGAELRAGRYPVAPGEVAVDAVIAEREGFTVGEVVRVAVAGPVEEQTLVGTFGRPGGGDLAGATVTMFDEATARARYGAGGATTVAVLAARGVAPEDLRDRVAAAVGDDYEVLTGAQAADREADDIGRLLGFLTTALLVFAGVSLFVAAFLIFNTFAITVAQRTRELALLRAVGASRGQVLGSVLAEAAVVGVAGSALGLGVGLLLARGLVALLDVAGFRLPGGDTVVSPRTAAVALAIGPLVTLVAALAPALRATRVAPVAALRMDAVAPADPSRVRLAGGAALLAGGVAALVAGLEGGAPLPVVAAGAVLVLLAVAALSSLLARPVARLVGLPVAATRGVAGVLACQNTLRNPRRTAATAAALMIGLGLVTFVLVFSESLRASLTGVVARTFVADYQLSPPDRQGLPDAAADAAAAVDGVATVARVRTGTIGVEGDARRAVALDPAALGRVLAPEVADGDLARLADGVALDLAVAEDLGVGVGDRVDVALADPDAAEAREVVAVYDRATLLTGGDVLVPLDRFTAAVPAAPLSSALVRLEDGATPVQVRPGLDAALAPFPAVRLADMEQVRDRLDGRVDQLLSLVVALLLLSVVIALFGIANTLGLSVLERTRELGLLRAVGMSRRQTRTMVRWESVLIAVFGAGLGLAVGLLFGWVFTRALEDTGLDAFAVPVPSVALAVVLAGLAGVLAAVVPAWRAARIDVLEALRVE